MHAFHKEVAVSDTGFAILECGTVDNDILTEDVFIANDKCRLVTIVVEVLRLSSKHGILINLVALAHAGSLHDAHVREDDAVVAYYNIILDICERIDCNVLADLCVRGYICFFTYHIL